MAGEQETCLTITKTLFLLSYKSIIHQGENGENVERVTYKWQN